MIVKNSLINNNFYNQPIVNKPKEEEKWLNALEKIEQNNKKENKVHQAEQQKSKAQNGFSTNGSDFCKNDVQKYGKKTFLKAIF